MNIRHLKAVGIVLPVMFWLLIVAVRQSWFGSRFLVIEVVFELFVILVGAAAFWTWTVKSINHREKEVNRRTNQLESLHAAALILNTELDLNTVLQKVVDLSRELTNARYGALGVLGEYGAMDQFITSGLAPEVRAQMGKPPQGHGLLGVLIRERKPIRIPEIAKDSRSVGFPPNHPPMHSMLGVPIISKGKVLGNLYLTDKLAGGDKGDDEHTTFTKQDQDILEMFATQAAIAIENAQLYRQNEQLAVLQERERFGMDLHDGIIQSIYAIGLMLEDGQHRITEEPNAASNRITEAIHGLNEVIRDIRNYILDLRPERFQGRDLQRGLEELARDVRSNSFLKVKLDTESLNHSTPSPEQTVEILHIVQEALANVRKHAHAREVAIQLFATEDRLLLSVADDGIGLDPEQAAQTVGNGLRNMQERAFALHGSLDVGTNPDERGTCISLTVPLRNGRVLGE